MKELEFIWPPEWRLSVEQESLRHNRLKLQLKKPNPAAVCVYDDTHAAEQTITTRGRERDWTSLRTGFKVQVTGDDPTQVNKTTGCPSKTASVIGFQHLKRLIRELQIMLRDF